jgi:hypothetical protein
MAVGETTGGRRLLDGAKWYGDDADSARAGDYGRVLVDERWEWRGCTPNGHYGNLAGHDVTEHEDGTITVSPSIRVSDGSGTLWHGYLERGVWREV